jgi:polar amino acid transport system substrate-binding protein
MSARIGRCAAALALTMISASQALSQNEAPMLRVATGVVPPLVVKENGSLTGFSIELWNAIAANLKVKTEFLVVHDVNALFEAVRSKQADIAVAEVFITWERDQDFDFSLPVLEAGQQIMVRDTGQSTEVNPLLDLLSLLISRTTLVWLGIAFLLILIPAHVVWFLERGREDGVIPSESYFPGIFQAMYWAATTLLTQAERGPRQWFARLIASFFMFIGIVFIAFYTAQLTTTLTVRQIRGDINGREDLPGRRVATIKGTISADYLRDHDARVQEFARLEDMYQALLDKKVDAVLFAAPILLYYAAHDGAGRVKMVGPEFDRQDIGFVFPVDSPFRRKVDSALLALRKDGTYQRIYRKWFGRT